MAGFENFKKHVKSDKTKWIATGVAGLLLTAAVIGLSVKVASLFPTKEIAGSSYSIGLIDADTGENVEGDTAIYLRKAVTVDGFKCEIAKDATIEYTLVFYDENDEWISSYGPLVESYDSAKIPEDAASVRIMITPLEDRDGKVTLLEVEDYADQLKVTVNKVK